jgi:hypothetical protein
MDTTTQTTNPNDESEVIEIKKKKKALLFTEGSIATETIPNTCPLIVCSPLIVFCELFLIRGR